MLDFVRVKKVNFLFVLSLFKTHQGGNDLNFIRKFRTAGLATLFILSGFFLPASLLHAQVANTPWPMFMHDVRHTGQSASSGPQENTLSWKYQTGSGIAASPVLGDDGTIYAGGIDGKLYAVSPGGGKKWSYETGGGISSSAAVDINGVIYAGSDDGYLYAIQKDGTLKWRYKTSGSITSSPTLNISTGALYFGSEDKNLYAMSSAGNLIWKTELDEEIWSSPALDVNNIGSSADDVLYVGTLGGVFYAINAADGAKKWTYDTQDIIIGSPAIDDANGVVLFGTGNGKIYALDKSPSNTSDVQPDWSYMDEDNQDDNMIISTPAVSADAIYAGSQNGFLYALNRTTGTLKWKYNAGAAITSSAAIDTEGNVYFGSGDGNIYSIDASGTQRWSYSAQDEVNSSPAIGDNELLYIGSFDGNLYAIGATTAATVTADFTATPTAGEIPLTVKFTDQSVSNPENMIASWQWDFGDGSTSSSQNPSHTYNSSGNFTVSLTVTSPDGQTDTETRENYISVSRKSSTIEATISDPEITFGESITITGSISPAHQAQVTLTLTDDEGETETETVTSDTSGAFLVSNYFPSKGGSWSVVASWDGDSEYGGAGSSPLTVTINPAEITELTIASSSSNIQIDQTITVSGTVTLTPGNETTRNEFLEKTLKLIRTDPNNEYEDIIETQAFLSGDQLGYQFQDVRLPAVGDWQLLVGIDEDDSFKGTNTTTIEIEVQNIPKEVAGYAILVEGRTKDKSGIDSHNLTTNYIYEKLINGGFTNENIYYFNLDSSQNGVDKTPSSEGVLDAIRTWAYEKIAESPAPLYIIFVGPGDKEEFLIYSDSSKKYDNINADNLADAVSDLEAQLNSNASEEPIIIILGANHSGGFVNKLSKQDTNRIVIASSDTEEVAYKGPLPPDETIRHGDYFVWELFKYTARGLSLKKCYEKAASKIAEFTENENGNGLITTENGQIAKAVSAGNGQYFDYSAQHPLLDDNGDGEGTYGVLSSQSGEDGGRSADLFISAGTSTTPLELSEVTDVTTLEAKDPAPTLYTKVSDTTNVDEVWIEITSPNHSLTKTGTATEQQVISLPRFSYTDYDSDTEKYLWDEYQGNKKFQNFKSAGKYGIFYFARDKDYGEITPFLASNVFRNKANVQKPGDFSYISPYAGEETAVGLMFDWEDAEDADTYTFQMSESSAFDTIKYEKKGLTDSIVVVDKTAGLRDGTTYYWTVMAINDGGITYMGTSTGTTTAHNISKYAVTKTSSSFTPKLANGYPGFIKGYIFDKDTNTKISDAAVSVQGAKGSYTTTDSGAYFLQLSSGDYTLSVDASGYATTAQKITVSALSTTTENIGLTENTQPASISGKVKEQKRNKPLKEVTITIKKKTFTSTVTTDSAGNYSVTDLESGRYTLTARKSGYKGYKKNIKLKAGKEIKLNIKLNKSGKKKVTVHPLP